MSSEGPELAEVRRDTDQEDCLSHDNPPDSLPGMTTPGMTPEGVGVGGLLVEEGLLTALLLPFSSQANVKAPRQQSHQTTGC